MRIVLDVSTTLAWGRPAVGIVRTEQRFAAFLLDQHAVDVGFCRFDRPSLHYVEVSRAVVAERLRPPADDRIPAPDPRGARMPLHLRARSALGRAVRRGIERLPRGVQPELVGVAQSADLLVRSIYWLARKTGSSLGARARPDRPHVGPGPGDEVAFRPDDVYVSMGLAWQHNDLKALGRLKRLHGFRTLLYCYDTIPVSFPHLMSSDARDVFAAYFVDLAHAADRVVAISHATRGDYLRFLADVAVPAPEVSVVHLGTDIERVRPSRGPAPREALANRRFVLCVGTIEARKNHELLYNVWDRLAAAHGDDTPTLVLAGMYGWGVDDLLARIRLHPQLSEKILILDQVADDGLLWLYEHCLFTVFPSLYEGWGLPVVESLALGKPGLVSTAPSVVEASQGLVPALDPLDAPEWLAHVERYAFEPNALREATERVRQGYQARSWQQHGESMLAVIHDLTKPGPPAA
jgi:glycosyltransferase involved in cell wall biosynthesis